MKKNTMTKEQTKEKALVYLSYRDHCEKELYDKLKRAGGREEDIAEVMQFLTENSLVDNESFAKMRAKQLFERGYGKRHIFMDLKMKDIETYIIESVLDELSSQYEDKLPALIDKRLRGDFDYKNIQRVTAYFVRRGYSYSDVKSGIKTIMEEYEYNQNYEEFDEET